MVESSNGNNKMIQLFEIIESFDYQNNRMI
jgi:hypothetical protein